MSVLHIVKRINYSHLLFDCVLVVASLYLSLIARVGLDNVHKDIHTLHSLLAIFVALRIATFVATKVYDIKWRYVSAKDAVLMTKAVLFSSLLIVATTYLVNIGRLPRSIFFIDAAFLILLMSGSRVIRRTCFEYFSNQKLKGEGKVTLLYGAGLCGRSIAHRISTGTGLGLRLLGFIDDSKLELGRTIYGTKVLGTGEDLPYLLERYSVQELIISFSNVSGEFLQKLIPLCKKHNVRLRLLADFENDSSFRSSELFRPVELGDLLGRAQKDVDLSQVGELISRRTVLITGAGGSIGSELSRQVLSFSPGKLIILDNSEYNLYAIDNELRKTSLDSNCIIIPALVDVADPTALSKLFEEHNPDVVFHAAAYKHVHLVEQNPASAILNNIGGTRLLVNLAEKNNVDTFVLISTDKAVNPVGVMGATKRVCELLVQSAGARTKKRFCSVRFGNVLGSSGSLIPLLQKQISNNEPLTITHPDMTRYFMLIPEAVSLVLRAATVASPGDVAVLKMGDSVRILDVATSLRALMGKTEDESPIVFTGVRPGEKMYEELYLCGDELVTEDPDIFILPSGDGVEESEQNELAIYNETQKVIDLAQQQDQSCSNSLLSLVNRFGRRNEVIDSGKLANE